MRPVPNAVLVCAKSPALIWLKVPEKCPKFQISKELLPAVIGAAEYAVVASSIFFQLLSVMAAVRVVPFAGDPLAAPLSRSNSNVADMVYVK